jgi:hypothetical protein
MTDITIYAGDSLVIEVTVSFDSGGSVSSLTGATLRASARSFASPVAVVDGSTSIAGDVATCTWAVDALAAGSWRVQLEVTKSGQTQTVFQETITVLPGNPAAT